MKTHFHMDPPLWTAFQYTYVFENDDEAEVLVCGHSFTALASDRSLQIVLLEGTLKRDTNTRVHLRVPQTLTFYSI